MTNPLSAAHLDTIYSALYEWRQGLRERNTIYIVNDYEQAIDRIDAVLDYLDALAAPASQVVSTETMLSLPDEVYERAAYMAGGVRLSVEDVIETAIDHMHDHYCEDAQPVALDYSHRNGDTEPPTVVGWYWFTGRTYSNGGTSGVWFVTVTSRSFVVGEEGEIEDWKGRWWGPVAPPWDSTAPTPDWASAPAYTSGPIWRESLQRRPPSE